MRGLGQRQVQQVADHREQVVAGLVDQAHLLALRGQAGQRGVGAEQLREAQHRVERRAQLVADAREEHRLGAVGRLGGEAVALRLLELAQQRRVGLRAEHAPGAPEPIPFDDAAALLDPAPVAVGGAGAVDGAVHRLGAAHVGVVGLVDDGPVVGMHQAIPVGLRVAQRVARVAEDQLALVDVAQHVGLEIPFPHVGAGLVHGGALQRQRAGQRVAGVLDEPGQQRGGGVARGGQAIAPVVLIQSGGQRRAQLADEGARVAARPGGVRRRRGHRNRCQHGRTRVDGRHRHVAVGRQRPKPAFGPGQRGQRAHERGQRVGVVVAAGVVQQRGVSQRAHLVERGRRRPGPGGVSGRRRREVAGALGQWPAAILTPAAS